MADAFHCKLVTPDASVLDDDITYASVPGWDGLFGVAPGRAAMLWQLGLGPLRLDFPKGGSRWFLVDGGVAHLVDGSLTLLCRKAIPVEQLNADEAKAEYEQLTAQHPHDAESAESKAHGLDIARLKRSLASAHDGRDGAI
ncbi:MAG: F0F1 ATP synthase subunit epsilon [Phycisphaerales bacterium]|nr:F0F1 ATP synthase subunit epsilon [Phycisphaerales bacterium]